MHSVGIGIMCPDCYTIHILKKSIPKFPLLIDQWCLLKCSRFEHTLADTARDSIIIYKPSGNRELTEQIRQMGRLEGHL